MHKIRLLSLTILGIVMLLLPERSFAVAAQPSDTARISFHFRLNDALLMLDYRGNQGSFSKLSEYLARDKSGQIEKIIIEGGYSPEGSKEHNVNLAMKRATSVENYIRYTYPQVQRSMINRIVQENMLDMFVNAVTNDANVTRRDKVLEILGSNATLVTKWANIKLLKGNPANYIEKNIFPELRSAVSCLIVMKPQIYTARETLKSIAPVVTDSIVQEIVQVEVAQPDTVPAASVVPLQQPQETEHQLIKQEYTRKPLFALKTNMLFDLASMINIELEVPIGKRFSVAGEWIFPWWLFENKQHCLQMLSGNIEGKYWLGNREKRDVMTGWHAGLYVGGGYYDLEWNKVGYQGEFFIAAGISGGYAHKIGKNLRLEYSLGIGFMQTHYRKYDAEIGNDGDWHLYRNSAGRYTWIGPTRARISLVWVINGKKKGGLR